MGILKFASFAWKGENYVIILVMWSGINKQSQFCQNKNYKSDDLYDFGQKPKLCTFVSISLHSLMWPKMYNLHQDFAHILINHYSF